MKSSKKTAKSNPLKYFNDKNDARVKNIMSGNKKLMKAQVGGTAFQQYLKNTPGATPADTLSGSAPLFDGSAQARALNIAKTKTYGSNMAPDVNPKHHTTAKGYFDKEGYQDYLNMEKAARIPQQKKGGPVNSSMTPKQKKFAALAPPKNKITFADKVAGAKKKGTKKK